MTRQLFDIQDTYGKTAKQLDNLMFAMVEDLKEYPISTIERAYLIWRQAHEKIPNPAGMIKTITSLLPKPQTYKTNEPNPRYNELTEKGKAQFDIAMMQAKAALVIGEYTIEKPEHAVSWFAKKWDQFTSQDFENLDTHMKKMLKDHGEERVRGYKLFLKNRYDAKFQTI